MRPQQGTACGRADMRPFGNEPIAKHIRQVSPKLRPRTSETGLTPRPPAASKDFASPCCGGTTLRQLSARMIMVDREPIVSGSKGLYRVSLSRCRVGLRWRQRRRRHGRKHHDLHDRGRGLRVLPEQDMQPLGPGLLVEPLRFPGRQRRHRRHGRIDRQRRWA